MMSHFTPLKTYQGLSIHELTTLIGNRDLHIWGCGYLGLIMKRRFEKNRLLIKSFCDNNIKLQLSYLDDVQVVDPKDVFNAVKLKQAFILIASTRYKHEIEKECIGAGLKITEDYLSYLHISRPEAAIDVSGMCNIKCPNCPQGNMERLRPSGYMTALRYEQVLNKLVRELPAIMNIELSTWGEPLMNPELAEIIQLTETSVPCTVSTNLQISDQLENVIKAQPSQMIISASGFGKSYEINHAGASWKVFLDNIHYLKALIDEYHPQTQITMLYHLYRDNQPQDLDNFRDLCLKLDFKFLTTWAYLNPYDKLLDYLEGKNIGMQAQTVLDRLPWNYQSTLALSKAEANKPCLCQRIFPIINWDLSVSLCHIYYNPVIASNYLDISIDELIKIRHKQFQCEICQKHGLHRLDIEVLLKKYAAENIFYQ